MSVGFMAVAAILGIRVDPGVAQDNWKRDFTLELATSFDSNVFRLSDGQNDNLGSGGARYADMLDRRDMISEVAVGGEIRRGKRSRRLRLGMLARGEIYSRNTRRSNINLAGYATKRIGKRNEISASIDLNPSEYRRNYLSRADPFDGPVFEEGIAAGLRVELAYARRLIGGSGPDLDVTLGLLGASRSLEGMPWRDRTQLGGVVDFDLKLSNRVDVELEGEFTRGSYAGGNEPVVLGAEVSMLSLLRDFNQTELGIELRYDLTKRARLDVGYAHRRRGYLAALGEDPVFGGRTDARNTLGAGVRYEVSKRVDVRFSGKFRRQDTFRPALGASDYSLDYSRTMMTLQLEYSR